MKSTKQKEKKKEKGVEGEEDRLNNRKEKDRKKCWVKYLDKRKYRVGTEPSALVYIGILVTSTTTGPGGSVVGVLASQAKGRWFNSQLWQKFFFPKHFSILPFQPLIYVCLLHKQKVGGSIPSCGKNNFSPSIFLSYLSNLLYKTMHFFFTICRCK